MGSDPRSSVLKHVVLSISGLLVATLAAGGCGKSNTFKNPPPPPVTVVHPENQQFTTISELPGRVEPVEEVDIRARVSGFLSSAEFQEGDMVEAGQLLFTIEPEEYQTAVNMATAELNSARANDALNREVLQKYQVAFDEGAATNIELLEAKAKVDVSIAQVESAEANLEKARLNLSYTQVFAPISGRISRILINVGNLVGAGEPSLLSTMVSTDPVYVYFSVRESDILEFRRQHLPGSVDNVRDLGIGFSLILPTGKTYPVEGVIDFVDTTIDANTGTIAVRGRIDNPEGMLKPGLFVRVEIPNPDPEEGLMVPEVAVMRDMAGDYVLLIDEDNVVSRQGVEIGTIHEHLAKIEKGLDASDRVIVDGLLMSRPGGTVNPTLKTIREAMEQIDPGAVAARAFDLSQEAFARMIEERTGRRIERPGSSSSGDGEPETTSDSGA